MSFLKSVFGFKEEPIHSYSDFWNWFEKIERGEWAQQRKLASLSIYNQASEEVARFELAGAWATRYKIADVNARSTDIEIEEVEIAFEEFKRVK